MASIEPEVRPNALVAKTEKDRESEERRQGRHVLRKELSGSNQ
jgi:hypothetical protein